MTGTVHRGSWPGRPAVATLTLDSPATRNALSRDLVDGLLAGLAAAAGDDGVRAVAIVAEGPAFCSGADLTEALGGGMREGSRRLVALLRAVVSLPKPVVAVAHGPVRAGGTGLVAACDVAVAADSATFAFTEARLSLAPAVVSLTVLPRVSARGASLAMLGGASVDGAAAERLGLVTRAVPLDALHAATDEILADLTRGTPQGLAATKRLLTRDVLARIDTDGDRLAQLSADLFASAEAQAAIRALLDRPRPARDGSPDAVPDDAATDHSPATTGGAR